MKELILCEKIRLHRLESRLSITEEVREIKPIQEMVHSNLIIQKPVQQKPKINSSELFLAEIRTSPALDTYLTERIEPKQQIIIQGVSLSQFFPSA